MEGFRSSSDLVRFAGFELDPHAGELRKDDGTRIRLQEQPLQILRILLEQPGRIIAREELRQSAAAIESYENGIAVGGMLALQKAFIGNVHGRSGDSAKAWKILDELEHLSRNIRSLYGIGFCVRRPGDE